MLRPLIFLPLVVLAWSGCSDYTSRAYFGEGENTAIRGYPTVGPPPNYTGVWTDYKYNGAKLAEEPYWRGELYGTAFYYKDDGTVYLIREYEHGHFVKDDYASPLPKEPSKIPFGFPQNTKTGRLSLGIKNTTKALIPNAIPRTPINPSPLFPSCVRVRTWKCDSPSRSQKHGGLRITRPSFPSCT